MKVEGVNKVVQNIGRIVKDDLKIIDTELEETARETWRKTRDNTPVITNRLRSGFNVVEKHLNYEVRNDVEYAGAVEFGVKSRGRSGRFMLTHAFNSELRMLMNRLKRIFR